MTLPFDPTDSSFNRANCLYLAHAADVAYHRSPARAALERLGLRAVAHRSKLTRVRAFLGLCDTHAVLAFRGSSPVTLQNWVTDVVAGLVERGQYVGRVHQGFSGVLNRSWDRIQKILEGVGDRPLFLTGHSMGGALAVLTATRLAAAGRAPVSVHTFGSPRIGDPAFCASCTVPTFRVVNRLDLVPEMPLASIKKLLPQKNRLSGGRLIQKLNELADRSPCYAHVDTLVYIDRDGEVIPDADIEPWTGHAVHRAIATRGRSFHEGLTDHMISSYIRGLEGKIGKQTGVRRRVSTESAQAF